MDIRRWIDLFEEKSTAEGGKLDRTIFIYLPPKAPKDKFAECGTCQHFLPGAERCTLFGKNDKVIAEASCSLYAHGKPKDDQEITGAITPKLAGYVEFPVRCENCSWFVDKKCELYELLNKKMPDVFNLDPNVNAKGCCNAFQQ